MILNIYFLYQADSYLVYKKNFHCLAKTGPPHLLYTDTETTYRLYRVFLLFKILILFPLLQFYFELFVYFKKCSFKDINRNFSLLFQLLRSLSEAVSTKQIHYTKLFKSGMINFIMKNTKLLKSYLKRSE